MKAAAAASSTVEAKPLFGTRSQNVSVGLGDRAVLKCRVDHLGTKTVCAVVGSHFALKPLEKNVLYKLPFIV